MGYGNWCIFGCLLGLAQLLLHGAMGLVLFWVLHYRSGFGWKDEPGKEFNYHPVLMIAGFIYLGGQALLSYRSYRCCQRTVNKLFHTVFHILAIPCIVMGFLTVLDSHNLAPTPIPNFYSLHSWMGLTTMGLFALQIVVGFFSFLILLCCEAPTAAFRAALVPVHATFGLITFLMAIATCLSGLTEKAFFALPKNSNDPGIPSSAANSYLYLPPEGLTINVLGSVIFALGLLVPVILLIFKRSPGVPSETGPDNVHYDSERL